MKHLGLSEVTHVTNRKTAVEMWKALKAFFRVEWAIEMANAEVLVSTMYTGRGQGPFRVC